MSTTDDDDNDARLFRKATAGARPLKQDRRAPSNRRRRPVASQRRRDEQAVLASLLSDEYQPDVETSDDLLFTRPGLQQRVIRQLRRGQIAVEGELDLHGHTVPEAREALVLFLHRAQRAGKRCVRVIHGKGHGTAGKLPVLKGKVNSWLRQRDSVLAFCSARPQDGGTGAVYILLKRE